MFALLVALAFDVCFWMALGCILGWCADALYVQFKTLLLVSFWYITTSRQDFHLSMRTVAARIGPWASIQVTAFGVTIPRVFQIFHDMFSWPYWCFVDLACEVDLYMNFYTCKLGTALGQACEATLRIFVRIKFSFRFLAPTAFGLLVIQQ